MKFININILFLFITIINIIRGQLEVSFIDVNQTPDNNNFIKYIPTTSSTECNFEILVMLYQSDGNGIFNVEVDNGNGRYSPKTNNNTNSLIGILRDVNIGTGSFNVIFSGNNNAQSTVTINYKCLDFEPSNYNFEVFGKPYYDNVFGVIIVIKSTGFPTYSTLPAYINGKPVSSYLVNENYRFLFLNYYYQLIDQNISGPVQIDFIFSKGSKSVTSSNYYNELVYDSPNITFYPDFNDEITLLGKHLYPLMTVETETQDIEPFYQFSVNGIFFTPPIKSIYQSCTTTTYLISPYISSMEYFATKSIAFYSQDKLLPYKVFDATLDVIDIQTTTFSTSQSGSALVVENDKSLLSIGIAPESQFLLNRIQLGLGGFSRMVDSPFGFTSGPMGGDNSNYLFNITVPRSPYNPSTVFKIFDSQITATDPTNTNTPNTLSPTITSYEFIYLTSSKYILRIGLSAPNCGLGYYTYETVTGYKKLASYIVSGDSYNGIYEIPYDLDIELSFTSFFFYDLCGYNGQIGDDQYISSLPFVKFNVPFLQSANTMSIFDIINVTYLYNNIDCSKDSVGNIIYINYPNINKQAPIAFRISELQIESTYGFYTKEFYGGWNDTLQMYQIEFVIPKNSKLGPFKYSIAIDVNNYISSDLLPEGSQLIISKSNLDGIGPIFTNIKRLPFESNKLGWSLTISDPINGFDNGTITVRGSMDNSIYKFNLIPSNMVSGTVHEGVYEIIIQVDSRICVNQDYIITFVQLWDTGAQSSVFELALTNPSQSPVQLTNPFINYFNDSTINKYPITCSNDRDLTPPNINSFTSSVSSLDVGSANNREITFTLDVYDTDSGINVFSPPIIYLVGESLEIVECFSELYSRIDDSNVIFKCTTEVPIAFASTLGVISLSVYGILNNHGLYLGYSSEMLKANSFSYKITTVYSLNNPLLLQSSRASSKGGIYFVYGRVLGDIEKLTITDAVTNQPTDYTTITSYGSNVISISNMNPILNDFYVSVTSKSGITSNKILVSPYLFLDYVPSNSGYSCQGSTSSDSSSSSTTTPTNSPQKCLGNPICGGPSNGYCNINIGCVCYYPYIGNDCLSKVINSTKPIVNPEEPSTSIDVPDEDNSIHYKSLISIYSLVELDINYKTVKEYKFGKDWIYTQVDDSKTNYYANITTGSDNFNTTVSVSLEWFNESKVISFAGADIIMNPSTMKYTIIISSYPFESKLNILQLTMSATFLSTSDDSCSLKEYGETSDNSNYMKIQIDNKALYAKFLKRGLVDSKNATLSNVLLDDSMNSIEKPSLSQSYIGIRIPPFQDNVVLDPDFSVLLSSYDASSNSNSICKSKGLSSGKIAGIVIGSVAFAGIIVVSIVYYIKKTQDSKEFTKKLSNLNKA